MLLLTIATIAILVFIAWQDFKYRAVYWWLFPLLVIALAIQHSGSLGWQEVVRAGSYNLLFLFLQLAFLTLYFSLKQKRWTNIFDGYFGLGDLLFLTAVTVYFSLYNYILYYAISLLLVIAISLVVAVATRKKIGKIPLAGYQALFLVAVMIAAEFLTVNWQSDQWLTKYLIF